MDNGKAAELSSVIGLLSDSPVFKRDRDIFVGGSFMFKHQAKGISTAISLEVLKFDLFINRFLARGILDDVNSRWSLIRHVLCLGSSLGWCFIRGLSFHFVDISLLN